MRTGYKTLIEFCNFYGKVDHTLRAWDILSDDEIEILKENHKKKMPEYSINIYLLQDGEYAISKIIQSIPDSKPYIPEDAVWIDS